jgi:predicted Holliday junction resolvase-like endonuclease
MDVAVICLTIVVVAILIVLTILIYNQMLLLNEVNKRLLLMAKESIDKERMTQEELQEALVNLEQLSNEEPVTVPPTIDERFHDNDLDI